ncbi:hypothetical protein B0H13DRAFT_2683540 [Mycena leptocephala]|nr:hypothetical protein B0H13DRAFT_2683540 [Mycena leptocephala]
MEQTGDGGFAGRSRQHPSPSALLCSYGSSLSRSLVEGTLEPISSPSSLPALGSLPSSLSPPSRTESFGNNALDTFLINSAHAALTSPGPFSTLRLALPIPHSDPTHSHSHSSAIRTRTRTRARASRIGASGSRLPPAHVHAPVGLIPPSLRLCLRLFPALPLSPLGAFCAATDEAVVEGGGGARVFVQSRLRLSLSLSLPLASSNLSSPAPHLFPLDANYPRTIRTGPLPSQRHTRTRTHTVRSASYCYFEPSTDPDYARGRACRAAHLASVGFPSSLGFLSEKGDEARKLVEAFLL